MVKMYEKIHNGIYYFINCKKFKRGWGDDLELKHLLHEHEDLSSGDQLLGKKAEIVVNTCNLSAGKAETGGLLELTDQPV